MYIDEGNLKTTLSTCQPCTPHLYSPVLTCNCIHVLTCTQYHECICIYLHVNIYVSIYELLRTRYENQKIRLQSFDMGRETKIKSRDQITRRPKENNKGVASASKMPRSLMV